MIKNLYISLRNSLSKCWDKVSVHMTLVLIFIELILIFLIWCPGTQLNNYREDLLLITKEFFIAIIIGIVIKSKEFVHVFSELLWTDLPNLSKSMDKIDIDRNIKQL